MTVVQPKPKQEGLTFALQALLDRHESYMAESEEERSKMAASLEQLEDDKRVLEARNAIVTQENQDLLHQLECMNSQIADSDAQIDSLMATLSSAQYENKRLMVLAARAAELEAEMTAMEVEQSRLREELVASQQEERSAIHRWEHAETTLRDLNDQIQTIEREARDEREKHLEICGQIERKRVIEKELGSAAGRLRGAAAASTLGRDKEGINVVSHFVRDILQDNANLQAGIGELRELLQTSNEEVQNLKEQVLQHQPVSKELELQSPSLMDEIQQCRPEAVPQELHVHHHYHAKITAKKERVPSFRRPPKRRGLTSSSANSSAGCQTPVSPDRISTMSRPHPGSQINRWSTQSTATDVSNISSLPNSPYSPNRSSSIFDRIDSGFESSRPTSPESACYATTRFHCKQQRPQSAAFTDLTDVSEDEPQSTISELAGKGKSPGARPRVQTGHVDANFEHGNACIGSDPRGPLSSREHPQPETDSLILELGPGPAHESRDTYTLNDLLFNSPALRRSNSQESLVSISGMDIHLPQKRDPRPCLRPRLSSTVGASDPLNFSVAFPSSQPLASIAEVNASSSNLKSTSTTESASPLSLLSGLASGRPQKPAAKGLGRFVGSWARGRWGVVPVASMGNIRVEAISGNSFGRGPGINQKGPIVGFKPPDRTPSEVHAERLDEDLLKESLVE
ncbi:hypothetical protein EPUS_06253 [Endocarpon pusillum Z07020]|uniref:Uncharacterized protein n=1 Tax=Endocarpon pusillum (strain Z07020 / HMAS-L-300199) TaxID=1263415 RepID=U1HIT2_ENDPU|nr:uncharacterized protein EPUS_06253 [Endocarpon pusillum Z07020]ERF68809.1 hypothetical protein EPUS_06253 [Endocarpon pusillum Z07020]